MSWLTAFFTKDKVKILTGIATTIGKLFLGKLADNAWTATQNAVWKAEQLGGTGDEKFERAYEELRGIVTSASTGKWVFSLLIELSVGVMRASKGLI